MTTLKDELKQSQPFASREEECFLNLMRTMSMLEKPVIALMKTHGTTPTQYNVLRILAGTDEDGLTCGEIKERMVTRLPDLTRLIDRLLKEGLVKRKRSATDRRVVHVAITPAGLKLAAELKPKLASLHNEAMAHMKPEQLDTLNSLLTELRSPRTDTEH